MGSYAQYQTPSRRGRGSCPLDTSYNDCNRPRSYKRRKRSFKSNTPAGSSDDEYKIRNRSAAQNMQTPASPNLASSFQGPAKHSTDQQPSTNTADAAEGSPTPQSGAASSSAEMLNSPLPEDVEQLKRSFLSMCSTLVTYSDGRSELMKQIEKLTADNESLSITLANRNGLHKQQMQEICDERDKLSTEVKASQQQKEVLEKELGDVKEQSRQSTSKHEQELKNTEETASKWQKKGKQLETDLKSAKQQVEVNKNRYELELRKQAELSQIVEKKDHGIKTKNSQIEALQKDLAGHSKAQLQKHKEAQELSQKLARREQQLQESLSQLRHFHGREKNVQSELDYAQWCLASANTESDEYAFANIWALTQGTSSAAYSRTAALEEDLATTKRTLKTRDDSLAKLKTEKAQLEKKLAEAAKVAETSINAEKTSKKTANTELGKLRREHKTLNTSHEATKAEVANLKNQREELERRLNVVNTENASMKDEKQKLLERESSLKCEIGTVRSLSKAQVDGLQSKLNAAKAGNASDVRKAPTPSSKSVKYACWDDVEEIFGKDNTVSDRILKIYQYDPENRMQVRVDGKMLLRPFLIPQLRISKQVDAEAQAEDPLAVSQAKPEEEILMKRPWSLSSIEHSEQERDALCEPQNYDVFNLPLKGEGVDHDGKMEDVEKAKPLFFKPENHSSAQGLFPTGAPPAPEFMQGAKVIRTGSYDATLPTANCPVVSEHASKNSTNVPTAMKGTNLDRIEIPKQQNKQPEVGTLPTPAVSEHASPRDSVMMTPRSPTESEATLPKPPKRPAPQDAAAHHRSPKRHAPSDAAPRAPRQPRNYDARFEHQQDRSYRPSYSENHRRRSSGVYSDRDRNLSGEDAAWERERRDSYQERVKQRERNEECYRRRW